MQRPCNNCHRLAESKRAVGPLSRQKRFICYVTGRPKRSCRRSVADSLTDSHREIKPCRRDRNCSRSNDSNDSKESRLDPRVKMENFTAEINFNHQIKWGKLTLIECDAIWGTGWFVNKTQKSKWEHFINDFEMNESYWLRRSNTDQICSPHRSGLSIWMVFNY